MKVCMKGSLDYCTLYILRRILNCVLCIVFVQYTLTGFRVKYSVLR